LTRLSRSNITDHNTYDSLYLYHGEEWETTGQLKANEGAAQPAFLFTSSQHRHRIDIYPDTLLANQTSRTVKPPITVKRVSGKMADCPS